jgi:hypothetical protein
MDLAITLIATPIDLAILWISNFIHTNTLMT